MTIPAVYSTIGFSITTFFVTLGLQWHYTRVSYKTMPFLCPVFIVIAVYASLMPFPLLVVDIGAAIESMNGGDAPKEEWMIPVWYTIMIVTYVMGWVVLPISQSYTEVGGFTVRRKLVSSIKVNAKLYAIYTCIFAVLFAYVVVLKGAYTSLTSIGNLATALANAWGLLLLVLFMSTGIVGVPKVLWRKSNPIRMLREVYYSAVEIQEDLDIAVLDLTEVRTELMAISSAVPEEHRPYWTRMIELIDESDGRSSQFPMPTSRTNAVGKRTEIDVSLEHLEQLHERVKGSIKIAQRMTYRWDATVRDAKFYEMLARGSKATNNGFKKVWFPMRGIILKLLALLCGVITLLILWSEVTLPFRPLTEKSISVVAIMANSGWELPASVIFLFYMAYCSYWAIFQLKVFDIYVILPEISDNSSLCFGATFLSRLIMPLCFNFLLMADMANGAVDVMYGHVYRDNMDASYILGDWLNRFLPAIIVLVSLLVFVNIAQCILKLIGLEVHSPNNINSEEVRQRIEDGYRLVSNALGRPLTAIDARVLGHAASEVERTEVSTPRHNRGPPAERGDRYREYLAQRMATEGARRS
ncbi:LMBR1-like membrane protein, putative [Trypanosoma equiperdum]|uniref:LMBR1-like membrane protein n=2 Tax=Trypanozoon TaxID=39700 RepID=Q584V8_TRYB2|nr:hypothetical protein, conserved [Trypanosoma brucei brucei TREU927]AAX80832.1 hypothetical protein, conserved [Trypanosoma brucei]AAZ11760.1 hypothetical protein, conserved [Trypanosoma brucei brucei TREU927]SCU69174.1 LMBR1-like membrane protein, putative [Trypanosoma equiperdum]